MLKAPRAVLGLFLGVTAPLFLCASAVYAADAKMSEGETKARASNCFSCHDVDHKLLGPAYHEIAKRYAGQGGAIAVALVKKIKMGGAGNWGDVPMTAHPELSDADIASMVTWILSLNPPLATASASGANSAAAMNTYMDMYGKTVQTNVAVFASVDQKTVTPAVFKGYDQYKAYCTRCHGVDAVGGGYAPDLRRSMANGMNFPQFLNTVMAGRREKGMPSWAGVFDEQGIHAIYDYIKARQLYLIPQGRPPAG